MSFSISAFKNKSSDLIGLQKHVSMVWCSGNATTNQNLSFYLLTYSYATVYYSILSSHLI